MVRVILLVGLCGSGKSHWASTHGPPGCIYFDDSASKYPALRQALLSGTDCIVEEVSLCRAEHRDYVMALLSDVPDLDIQWVYFENDLDSANHNVTHRTNKGNARQHRIYNERLHIDYSIPPGVVALPITRLPVNGAA